MIQVLVHLEELCTLLDKTSYQIGLEVPMELGAYVTIIFTVEGKEIIL